MGSPPFFLASSAENFYFCPDMDFLRGVPPALRTLSDFLSLFCDFNRRELERRATNFWAPPHEAKSSVSRALSRILSDTRFFGAEYRIFQKSATCLQKLTLAGRPDEGQIASILSAFAQIPKVVILSKNSLF